MSHMVFARAAALAGISICASAVLSLSLAAGEHSGGHGGHHSNAAGAPGEAAQVSRTVDVVMYDNYYEPESITVQAGETIRFVVRNDGELVHEFNIGTAAMHAAHQDEMMMMVDHGVLEPDRINHDAAKAMQASMGHGMHEEPNSVLLEPGDSAEIVWVFPDDGEIEFACNVPGHYDAGMQGYFSIEK
jgi:uncharacterized cupredoxin-like copper-binding protein